MTRNKEGRDKDIGGKGEFRSKGRRTGSKKESCREREEIHKQQKLGGSLRHRTRASTAIGPKELLIYTEGPKA